MFEQVVPLRFPVTNKAVELAPLVVRQATQEEWDDVERRLAEKEKWKTALADPPVLTTCADTQKTATETTGTGTTETETTETTAEMETTEIKEVGRKLMGKDSGRDWDAVKRDYVSGIVSSTELSRKYDIPRRTIRNRIIEWVAEGVVVEGGEVKADKPANKSAKSANKPAKSRKKTSAKEAPIQPPATPLPVTDVIDALEAVATEPVVTANKQRDIVDLLIYGQYGHALSNNQNLYDGDVQAKDQKDDVEPDCVTVEPETVETETVEPETVEPETVEPETVEPYSATEETAEPETEGPETAVYPIANVPNMPAEPDIVQLSAKVDYLVAVVERLVARIYNVPISEIDLHVTHDLF